MAGDDISCNVTNHRIGNVRVNVTLRRSRVAVITVWKYCIFWVCVFSLDHTACNAHAPYYIVICGMPAAKYFSTLSHKRHDFRKNVTEHKIRISVFSTTSKSFSFEEEFTETLSKVYTWLHAEYLLFLSDFNEIWIVSADVWKLFKY